MKHQTPNIGPYLKSRIFLRFQNDELENQFADKEFTSKKQWIRIASVFGVVLIAGFYPLDRIVLPEEALHVSKMIRLVILPSITLVALLSTFFSSNIAAIRLIYSFGITIIGLMWSFLLWIVGPSASFYMSAAVTQTFMFVYLLLGIPFRMAVIIAWSLTVITIVTIVSVGAALEVFIVTTYTITVICLITTLAAYSLEWSNRTLFILTRELNEEREHRTSQEYRRTRWLALIADFLRHELSGSMTGIKSSVELIDRRNTDPVTSRYLSKAKDRIQFMRHLLQEASGAASLEQALQHHENERVELSQLLSDHVEDYRVAYPAVAFSEAIEPEIEIRGSIEHLTQMIEKLLNNAIEHTAPNSPIEITLEKKGDDAILTVRNQGEPLPADSEKLFEPFYSRKVEKADDNLGLGLYVARVIAEHHDGVIVANTLVDALGAEFTVTIPMESPFNVTI